MPVAEASHDGEAGIGNNGAVVPKWQPPMDQVASTSSTGADGAQKNDTCYNRQNCEACWKDACFALADAAFEECMAVDVMDHAGGATAESPGRTIVSHHIVRLTRVRKLEFCAAAGSDGQSLTPPDSDCATRATDI